MPFWYRFSMTCSSQSKSYSPSRGSSLAQAKMANDTQFILASFIRCMSVSSTPGQSSHWSGL